MERKMTLKERINNLRVDFFLEAVDLMTEADYEHLYDKDYEFSLPFDNKLDELLEYDEDWYYAFFEWMKKAF